MARLILFFRHEAANVRHVAHQMEFDPETQWRFHRKMCWFWIGNFIPVTVLLFGLLTASTHLAILLTAIMLGLNTYYSLYANFDTEFDAVSAAYAAMRADVAADNDVTLVALQANSEHLSRLLVLVEAMATPPQGESDDR